MHVSTHVCFHVTHAEIGLALSILSADDNQIQMVSTESANTHRREDIAITDNHTPLACVCRNYSLNSCYYEQLIHS